MKNRLAFLLLCAVAWPGAAAEPAAPMPIDPGWTIRIEQLATQAAQAALGGRIDARIEVVAGTLDSRLKLVPCQRIDAYLPAGQRAWGRTRVGLRCLEGPVAWNVYLPLTVRVLAPAWVAVQALPAGTVLEPDHLRLAEADWAGADSPPIAEPGFAVGRTLARPLAAGTVLRDGDLKKRTWFAVGDPVRIHASGPGFSVSSEGVALTPGLEGQPAKVRTEAGRTVTGLAVGSRRIEVSL